MSGVEYGDGGGLFSDRTPWGALLARRVGRLNTGFRFAPTVFAETAHARSAAERAWIEALFTRVVNEPVWFTSLQHVDARVLAGAPMPSMAVPARSEVEEGRILRRRRHELGCFFVREHAEVEYLLHGGVESGRYLRTPQLFRDEYEVSFAMHVDVPCVVLYFGNFMSSHGEPTPGSSLFHRLVFCLLYTDWLRQVACALLRYAGVHSAGCRGVPHGRLYWISERSRSEMRELGLANLVGQSFAGRLAAVLLAIDRVQWSRVEPHRNRYPMRSTGNSPVFGTGDFVPWDVELWRVCLLDSFLDGPVAARSRGARVTGSCYAYRQRIYVWLDVSFQEAVLRYERQRHRFAAGESGRSVDAQSTSTGSHPGPMDTDAVSGERAERTGTESGASVPAREAAEGERARAQSRARQRGQRAADIEQQSPGQSRREAGRARPASVQEMLVRLDDASRRRRQARAQSSDVRQAAAVGEDDIALEETPLQTPYEALRERMRTEAWNEAQSSSPSMRLAELGTSAFSFLNNEDGLAFEYSDIAGGRDQVGRFVVRVISGMLPLPQVEEPSTPPRETLPVDRHTKYFLRPRPRQARRGMPASFTAPPPPPVESGRRSDSDGYYTVFGRAGDALRVEKGSSLQDISFWYGDVDDDYERHPLMRARALLQEYKPIVVHEDGLDVYYLPTLVPLHTETGETWTEYCADVLVWVLTEPEHQGALDRIGLSEEDRTPPDRNRGEVDADYDERLTAWGIERWADLCYLAQHGWLDGERGVVAKNEVAEQAAQRDEQPSTAILAEAEERRSRATKLVVLTYFALHRPGRPGELQSVRTPAMEDYMYPPELRSWRHGRDANAGENEGGAGHASRRGTPGPSRRRG